MNRIYLPTLKNITINDYSLYPNGLNLEFKFINGVNLIVGGNGTGKTTFINIIKYAIIGLYKNGTVIRIYKNQRREKRETHSYSYFSDRMDKSYINNEKAEVIIEFDVNDTHFKVTRSLFDVLLKEVEITENNITRKLEGELIKQNKYDNLTKSSDKESYLQYKYEEFIIKKAGLSSFDDLIVFINDILMFDERRKTVLWDSEFQSKIMHKYFSDPDLNNEYSQLLNDRKYFDSLSRHKSEDGRVLKKVIDNYLKNQGEDPVNEESDSKSEYEEINKKLASESEIYENLLIELKKARSEKIILEKKINELESVKEENEKIIYSTVWDSLNPRYTIYENNIKQNNICPMCNKSLSGDRVINVLHEGKCMLCSQEISLNKDTDTLISSFDNELLRDYYIRKQNIEGIIVSTEEEIESLEDEIEKLKSEKTNLQLRIQSNNDHEDLDSEDPHLEFLINNYDMLMQEQKKYKKISDQKNKEAKDIELTIDEQRKEITIKLSEIFESYANKFLGMSCYMEYMDDDEGNSRYVPVINHIPRLSDDSLSESQRFFIDHSFRMSLLEYFYSTPSFYICETPESSLDLSYEKNASEIFLQYLQNENVLILTINLNKNQFLEHIIQESKNINYLNLLEVGKCSNVQSENIELNNISKRIEALIHDKQQVAIGKKSI